MTNMLPVPSRHGFSIRVTLESRKGRRAAAVAVEEAGVESEGAAAARRDTMVRRVKRPLLRFGESSGAPPLEDARSTMKRHDCPLPSPPPPPPPPHKLRIVVERAARRGSLLHCTYLRWYSAFRTSSMQCCGEVPCAWLSPLTRTPRVGSSTTERRMRLVSSRSLITCGHVVPFSWPHGAHHACTPAYNITSCSVQMCVCVCVCVLSATQQGGS